MSPLRITEFELLGSASLKRQLCNVHGIKHCCECVYITATDSNEVKFLIKL